MLSHPAVEFEILTRARWLATQLTAVGVDGDFERFIRKIDEQLLDQQPDPDSSTWFAMERVAGNAGLRAVRFISPGQNVEEADMVWVSKHIEPNENDAKALSGVHLVVANEAWQQAIAQAKAKANIQPPKSPSP